MTNKLPLDPKRLSPSVAVIGLLGAGKTTLACTLANRLVQPDANGVQLVPSDHNTLVAVQRDWAQLQSREWPMSTPRGAMIDLRWKLHVGKATTCDLRIVDVSGQDLYHIFAEDRCRLPDQIDAERRPVFEYCRTADIVLFLLNLGDFVGEGDANVSINSQAAMKSALDYLLSDAANRRVCILLTQAELYKAEAKERGGWLPLLSAAVPFIYNAHLREKAIPVFPVSAVYDTEIVNDPASGPRRVPKPGFRSFGLDSVIAWLVSKVRGDHSEAVRPVRPVPVLVECNAEWRGLFQKTMTWTGTIRNDGADGFIRVIATAQRHGKDVERRFVEIELEAGQSEEVTIRLTDTTDKDGKDGVTVGWTLEP